MSTKGRPSTYDPKYCEEVISFMAEGKSFEQYAAKLGKERKTLYNWMDAHEEFRAAKAHADEMSEAWWDEMGRLGTFGLLPDGAKLNATSYIYNRKCRHKGKWLEDGTTNKLEITAKHTNMSDKELNRLIQAKHDRNIIDVTPLKLTQGLQDAKEGLLVDKGSFSQYIDEDSNEIH